MLVKFFYQLTFEWGHSIIICTFQMGTLLLLFLAISEDWNVLQEIAYTRHKMEAEDKMEDKTLVLHFPHSSNYSEPNHGLSKSWRE